MNRRSRTPSPPHDRAPSLHHQLMHPPLLAAHGADANVKNSDGQTALHMACVVEHKMTILVLLRKGAVSTLGLNL